MSDRLRCAVSAAQRDEPLIGTASRVRSWLLLEQAGAWGPSALLDSGLGPVLGPALAQRGRESGTRVLVIRRPGWRGTSDPRRCFLARTGPRSSWIEALSLDDPADVLDLDWERLQDDAAPGIGRPHPGGAYLVCTHGRHDACCADHGRPLVRALAAAGVEEVWESSHVGGDRFAGNVVCLPDGTYFGRVSLEGAAGLVADHRRGRLRLDHYRGRSCYQPLVQVAELWAREAAGVDQVYGLWPARVERPGPQRVRVTFRLRDGGDPVRVTVFRRHEGAARLTCTAGGESPLWSYHLEGVDRLAS